MHEALPFTLSVAPPLRRRSRLLRLLTCKRVRNTSASLPIVCGFAPAARLHKGTSSVAYGDTFPIIRGMLIYRRLLPLKGGEAPPQAVMRGYQIPSILRKENPPECDRRSRIIAKQHHARMRISCGKAAHHVRSRSFPCSSNRTVAVVPLPGSDVNESFAPCSAAIS